MADNTTGELSDLCDDLSRTLEEKYKIVADYESAHEHAVKLTIRAKAAATARTKGTPMIVKMLIENDPQVVDASDKESEAFKILTYGNAEIKGLEAMFQSAKHQMQLKIQELRSLGGYGNDKRANY